MVAISETNKAVAASIGGDYIRFKVFDWLDNAARLNSKESIEIKDPEDALPFEQHLVQIAKSTDSRIPVYVTNAAPVEGDEVILPFFKNPLYHGKHDYEKEKYYPARSVAAALAQAGLDPKQIKMYYGNDMQMNLNFVIQSYASELKPGDLVYHVIGGQGLNAGSALVGDACTVTGYQCNEPGHQEMPLVEENLLIEGPERKNKVDPVTGIKAAAEPYCAGGNVDDLSTGPTATVNHICSLSGAKLNEALSALSNKTGIGLDAVKFQQSPLFALSKETKFTTRDIGKAATQSDPFAQAVMIFTAGRIADFMIDLIQKENRVNSEHPLKMISLSGGWMENLSQNCPQAWNLLETRLQDSFGKELKIYFVKPEQGFDGTIELAKTSLLAGRETQSKPGFFKRIWNSIKKLFGFSS